MNALLLILAMAGQPIDRGWQPIGGNKDIPLPGPDLRPPDDDDLDNEFDYGLENELEFEDVEFDGASEEPDDESTEAEVSQNDGPEIHPAFGNKSDRAGTGNPSRPAARSDRPLPQRKPVLGPALGPAAGEGGTNRADRKSSRGQSSSSGRHREAKKVAAVAGDEPEPESASDSNAPVDPITDANEQSGDWRSPQSIALMLALFASLGANLYLMWSLGTQRGRYRALVKRSPLRSAARKPNSDDLDEVFGEPQWESVPPGGLAE